MHHQALPTIMNTLYSRFLSCALTSFFLIAAIHATDTLAQGQLIARLENANITESSGICASRRTPGVFWTHNDSSAGSYLYAFDATGKDLGMFNYQTGSEDIEDIAAIQIAGIPYLLVGNTGSHAQVGARRRLYLIKEPLADATTSRQSLLIPLSDLTVYTFTWPNNENIDCEAVAINGYKQVFLASKQNTGCRLFLLTPPSAPGAQATIRHVSSPNISKVSAMDLSPDGRSLLLLTNTGACREFTLPIGSVWGQGSFSYTTFNYPSPVPGAPQPEGICYSADGNYIYATSELGGNTGSHASGGFRPGGQCPLYKMISRNGLAASNQAPVAQNQTISTTDGAAVAITLHATDADNNALTYTVVSNPAHGSLSGTAANILYQPTTGYIGTDSFTFSASDGVATSAIATVSIDITAAPVITYALTVTNGSGDGSYLPGAVVTITADPAPTGQLFSAWTGSTAGIANIAAATTTLTMPASAVTIAATYTTPVAARRINLNGAATTINGNAWTSYSNALGQGLSITPAPLLATTTVIPSPAVDTNTKAMLNTAIWNKQTFTINQNLSNGNYSVSLWLMENYATNHRSFNVSIEGISKESGIGALPLGAWKTYTYSTTVSDGQLNITLTKVLGEPGLMGLEIIPVSGIAIGPRTPPPVAVLDVTHIIGELFTLTHP